MAGNVRLNGTIVEKDPESPFGASPNDGLYLLTGDQQVLALVTDYIATQMPIEQLHRQSRATFEPYIGKKVSVEGYLSGGTLWSAMIVDQEGNNKNAVNGG